MFWAIDLDDFRGYLCNKGKYPLMNALKDCLGTYTGGIPPQVTTTTKDPPAATTTKTTATTVTRPPNSHSGMLSFQFITSEVVTENSWHVCMILQVI